MLSIHGPPLALHIPKHRLPTGPREQIDIEGMNPTCVPLPTSDRNETLPKPSWGLKHKGRGVGAPVLESLLLLWT